MTAEMLEDFARRVMKRVHVEGFMFGNLTRDRALTIADSVEAK
jgi:secreted Zn-dependent insulinase-like peptidase